MVWHMKRWLSISKKVTHYIVRKIHRWSFTIWCDAVGIGSHVIVPVLKSFSKQSNRYNMIMNINRIARNRISQRINRCWTFIFGTAESAAFTNRITWHRLIDQSRLWIVFNMFEQVNSSNHFHHHSMSFVLMREKDNQHKNELRISKNCKYKTQILRWNEHQRLFQTKF